MPSGLTYIWETSTIRSRRSCKCWCLRRRRRISRSCHRCDENNQKPKPELVATAQPVIIEEAVRQQMRPRRDPAITICTSQVELTPDLGSRIDLLLQGE